MPSGGPQLGLTYALTFDRDGNEIGRAIRENGDAVDEGIRDCVQGYPVPPFHAEPSDGTMNVEVFASYP